MLFPQWADLIAWWRLAESIRHHRVTPSWDKRLNVHLYKTKYVLKLLINLFLLCYSVQRSFSNAAFKEKTQQHPNISNSSLLAVDGDLNTRSELGPASSPWWKVDLGREGMVTGVRLALNITNHGIDRGLVNITVTNKTGDSLVCASIDEDDVSGDPVHLVTSCDEPLLGRYVQVEMHVAGDCSKANCEFTVFLYEVEVMLGKNLIKIMRRHKCT